MQADAVKPHHFLKLKDLKVLGVGYVPIQDTGGTDTSEGVNNSFPLIAGTGAVIAGIIAYFTLRKRKK